MGKGKQKAEAQEAVAPEPAPVMRPPEIRTENFSLVAGFHHTIVRYRGACCNGQHMFVFGHNGAGQLGLAAQAPEVREPAPLWGMDGRKVSHIATGYSHTFFLEEHRLYGCGSNDGGQLGLPPGPDVREPVLIPAFTSELVLDVAAGRAHSVVCCSLQFLPAEELHLGVPAKVYTFGAGTEGCLGQGDKEHRHRPTEVEFFRGRRVRQVAASRAHTVVMDDSAVFVFGVGAFGGLCTPLFTPFALYCPTPVGGLEGRACRLVAAGGHHTVVWCTDGVYTFGCAADGALGYDVEGGALVDVARPVPTFADKTVLGVAAGRHHTLVWCSDGVYSFGAGAYGQLGLGRGCMQTALPTLIPCFSPSAMRRDKVVSVHCGCFSSFVLTTKGLFAFGDWRYGKLGTAVPEDHWEPRPIPGFAPYFTPVLEARPDSAAATQLHHRK